MPRACTPTPLPKPFGLTLPAYSPFYQEEDEDEDEEEEEPLVTPYRSAYGAAGL